MQAAPIRRVVFTLVRVIALYGSAHLDRGWATSGCIGAATPFAKFSFRQGKVSNRVSGSRGHDAGAWDVITLR